MTAALDLFESARRAKTRARGRATGKHADEIGLLTPLALELARKAGSQGITAGDIRLVARQRGMLEEPKEQRGLSWLAGLPKAAGLIATARTRMSPSAKSRNKHVVYLHPDFA